MKKNSNHGDEDFSTEDESGSEEGGDSDNDLSHLDEPSGPESGADMEDDDWLDYDEAKKENALETKSKETHEVHAPYFPSVRNLNYSACIFID